MFESLHTIHWLKKGPLAIVWTAANLNKDIDLRNKLNRRKCVKVNIAEACQMILTTEVPLSLCLTSRLMLGIARIHQRQTHFALIDSEYLRRRFEVLSAVGLDFCQARPDQITYPEPDFNASFSSISDLQAFSILFPSSPMSSYFRMELDIDKRLIASDFSASPPPRSGSVKGTPPADGSFIADLKDISIEEEEAEYNLLETSLMESMYFGDEDPILVTKDRGVHNQTTNLQPEERKQDLILLFEDSSNSFSYSDGGGAADISSSVIVSPMATCADQHAGERKTLMPIMFESPFLNKNTSHPDICVPPSSTNQLPTVDFGSPNELLQSQGDCLTANVQPMKKRRRKGEKFVPIDGKIVLSRREMKAGTSDVKVLTRQVDLRARKRPKLQNSKDLLFQMYTELDNKFTLSKSLVQPPLVIEKTDNHEFTLEMDLNTNTITTPVKNKNDDSMSHSFHSELEVVRGGSRRDDTSYDNPLTNASAMSGDTTIRSSRGHSSFQISTALRIKAAELESKDTQNLPPLVTGGLSPIMDLDEDISGASVGAMPSLDDSSDYQQMQEERNIHPISPFIERNPENFSCRIRSLLEYRKQIKFKELLPEGSTRKTAGIAFHHILTILSSSSQLKVEQTVPYGSIVLKSSISHQSLS